ncbi:hypothetical protein [Blastococcus tunisiensis]|uniref:Uncharacterized protein n=1 Tax=Blastococcus tunisiensis TaxID=1798228 RepID=A0A1I2LA66_9ACTN|nr:hypothetical protein [Blastococcus sp. DSM 46838]SFF73996.1 hypothetical protein SAMN05216574_12517 [Blastococcus sp. DSM 46838]
MQPRVVEFAPDDHLFADWCAAWAAVQLVDPPVTPAGGGSG